VFALVKFGVAISKRGAADLRCHLAERLLLDSSSIRRLFLDCADSLTLDF
jgi:hypothetical protein